jgi:hypothetical protein
MLTLSQNPWPTQSKQMVPINEFLESEYESYVAEYWV